VSQNPRHLVSFRDAPGSVPDGKENYASKESYLPRMGHAQPHTGLGVHLDAVATGGAPEFLLHEFGNREQLVEWEARNVMSPFWRLYYNAAPGAYIVHEGREMPLGPEHIWLIAENICFDGRKTRTVPHMWLHFSVRPAYAFPLTEPLAVPMDATLRGLVDDLRAQRMPPLDTDSLRGLFFRGLALIHATFARAPLPPARPLPAHLREVIRRIERAPGEELSNARMARLCGLSTGGFTRLFTSHFGMPPAAYVRRARINYASRLLAFSDLSIEQIADTAGFPNRHHFTRVFAKHIGCGPAMFRKLHQNGLLTGAEE
jgi:AraC-like DNA-binding protein